MKFERSRKDEQAIVARRIPGKFDARTRRFHNPLRSAPPIVAGKPHDHFEKPSDEELLRQVADGRDAALSALMDRYDRLVRFTIFRCSKSRCLRDSMWLDGIASDVWSSLVFSARRRDIRAHSFRTYLIQMARFKTIDAVRRSPDRDGDFEAEQLLESKTEADADFVELLEQLEEVDRIRECMARLSDEERLICTRIHLIVERRWREAGDEIGMAESTLRSRWPKILDRLRGFMNKSEA